MEEFYLSLLSDCSMDIFSKNKQFSFTTKLDHPFKLKKYNIEFVNHFDSFLESGKLPQTYYRHVKVHLNVTGIGKLLSNVNNVNKVTQSNPKRRSLSYRGRSQHLGKWSSPPSNRGPRSFPQYCHICCIRGHSTQECWFNSRNAGMTSFSSY